MKKNPFKELETNKEVPKELKKTVMNDVAIAKLFMEFGDLFLNKYTSVFKGFFDGKKK